MWSTPWLQPRGRTHGHRCLGRLGADLHPRFKVWVCCFILFVHPFLWLLLLFSTAYPPLTRTHTRLPRQNAEWPPKGTRLSVRFTPPVGAPAVLSDVNLTVVYELYDGAPLMNKWVEISFLAGAKTPTTPLVVEQLVTELLALNCDYSSTAEKNNQHYISGLIHLQTTAAHGSAIHWLVGRNASNDPGACEPVVNVSYSPSLYARVDPSNPFASFRTMLLLHDSFDPTRQMLARHQVVRRLARLGDGEP